MNEIVIFIIGFLSGGVLILVISNFYSKNKLNQLIESKNNEIHQLELKLAQIETEINAKGKAEEEYKKSMLNTFKAAASDALSKNNETFIELAKSKLDTQVKEAEGDLDERKTAIEEMLKPVKESIDKYKKRIEDLEKGNKETFGQVSQLLTDLQSTNAILQKETGALVSALKNPSVRGRWGEIGLKNIVEFAGMNQYCDFNEQAHQESEEGNLRPDLIVNLPGGGHVVVDSKLPLNAYMEALETDEENQREVLLAKHTKDLKGHIMKLSQKKYWSQFENTPDFVVLYMHVESAFNVAMMNDKTLLQEAMKNKIILATPTSLIVILKSVALSWKQHDITENAKSIMETGKELHERVSTFAEHIHKVGSGLKSAVSGYNDAVGSWKSRVLPSGRKLEALKATNDKKELLELDEIETPSRSIKASENE